MRNIKFRSNISHCSIHIHDDEEKTLCVCMFGFCLMLPRTPCSCLLKSSNARCRSVCAYKTFFAIFFLPLPLLNSCLPPPLFDWFVFFLYLIYMFAYNVLFVCVFVCMYAPSLINHKRHTTNLLFGFW